jgi:hypothetical protein
VRGEGEGEGEGEGRGKSRQPRQAVVGRSPVLLSDEMR